MKWLIKLKNGEYALFVTFWIFNVLFNLLGIITLASMKYIPVSIIPMWMRWFYVIALVLYNPILFLGAWRSATKYDGRFLWAVLAKTSVICGCIVYLVSVCNLLNTIQHRPTITESLAKPDEAYVSTHEKGNTKQQGKMTPEEAYNAVIANRKHTESVMSPEEAYADIMNRRQTIKEGLSDLNAVSTSRSVLDIATEYVRPVMNGAVGCVCGAITVIALLFYRKRTKTPLQPHKTTQKAPATTSTLRRRWILAFLVLSFLFCTFFTPWKTLYRINPKEYSFWKYSPIFSEWDGNQNYRDPRSIDLARLAMWETIIGLACTAGFVYQNKKS